jgi:hypothetical protein
VVAVGDVWWLPAHVAQYPGGKDRYCLIVALETEPGQTQPSRAHYVVGSTGKGGRPAIVVQAGEAGPGKQTFFRFWWSGSTEISTITNSGKRAGNLVVARLPEIIAATRDCKLVRLKRLMKS